MDGPGLGWQVLGRFRDHDGLQDQWRMRCDAMLAAGFHAVPSSNPYWDRSGRTFEDFDGYRVVLQAAAWSSAAVGEADPG